ncbi:ABC transporter permease [Streptomyces sp. So13.3]|uniref:ABC transporter permease n=1 Tax=Streptomyces TaxID=1883 RepID=UPI00110617F6|nr:ABC transporter permease [Streptomyces sp. So13.3]QNA76282.1 ABC transporter permease [Streptomyces sp. So13.3]
MASPATSATALVPIEPETTAPDPSRQPKRRYLRFLASPKAAVGAGLLFFFTLIALFGTLLAPHDPTARSNDLLQSPSLNHLFGTTHLGQDVFSQVVEGTRSVMYVGVVAGAVATTLAVLIGVTSGYLSGVVSDALSALTNVFLVIPALLLIVIITSSIPDGGETLVALVIGFTSWAWGARVLRAQTLSLRRRDFIEAARATGESTWRIIVFELMPNLSAVIISGFIGTMIYAVMSEIILAFIGVPGLSAWNWGTILYWAQGQQALAQGAWWWFVPAGLAIAVLGTALALVNFGIDEFVNPRLRNNGERGAKSADGRPVRMRVGFTPVVAPLPALPDPSDTDLLTRTSKEASQ